LVCRISLSSLLSQFLHVAVVSKYRAPTPFQSHNLAPREALSFGVCHGIRWDIETFFKCTKSFLQLGKEFQERCFDMLISHTTIVFARYIMLSWQHRQQGDFRILGGLFLAMCDELAESLIG